MDITPIISTHSLLEEITPLYLWSAVVFLWFITLKRAIVGKPKLTLFRIAR